MDQENAKAKLRVNFLRESNRRSFLQATAGLTAVGSLPLAAVSYADEQGDSLSVIRPGDKILFQGDSITDTKRERKTAGTPNRKGPLGNGYTWLTAASMLTSRPGDRFQIFNRGISGNKVFQLAKRWEKDCLDLKPDVLSILIGVNDIWHNLNGKYDGTVETYEKDYHALVERTKEALPKVRLVICEPFVLRCGAVDDKWFPSFDGYRAAALRVCEAAGATFVPFQAMFDEAVKLAPPEHWAKDGVHPTPAGAALMANCWLRTVGA